MNESQERAADALDLAIAEVFCDEVTRLGLSEPKNAYKVNYAISELHKLRTGNMPKYNELVAPFYVSWYQGSQINLAYSMITDFVDNESTGKDILTDTGRLYVFDFGCGALAMQFGVALAIADALRKNQEVHSAYIACNDKSEAMTNIGKKIWEQFKSEVQKDAGLPYLEQACELIEAQTDKPFRMPQNNEIIWISAIHAAYEVNQVKVKKTLARLTDKLQPNAGFVTSHEKSAEIIDFISPFHRKDGYTVQEQIGDHIFTCGLPETTRERLKLRKMLRQWLDFKPMKYLNRSVTFGWRDATIRIYTRQ